MASTFSTIAIVALILGVVFLIAAVVVFIHFKIWIVMADLSGKTAQMSIEQIRKQSGQPAKRVQHRGYVVNSSILKRNKGTDELRTKGTEQIGKRFGKKTDILKKEEETVPLKRSQSTGKLETKAPAADADATELLSKAASGTEATELLGSDTGSADATEVLAATGTAATEILKTETAPGYEGTTVLKVDATTVIGEVERRKANFRIITDIVMTHTDETII